MSAQAQNPGQEQEDPWLWHLSSKKGEIESVFCLFDYVLFFSAQFSLFLGVFFCIQVFLDISLFFLYVTGALLP